MSGYAAGARSCFAAVMVDQRDPWPYRNEQGRHDVFVRAASVRRWLDGDGRDGGGWLPVRLAGISASEGSAVFRSDVCRAHGDPPLGRCAIGRPDGLSPRMPRSTRWKPVSDSRRGPTGSWTAAGRRRSGGDASRDAETAWRRYRNGECGRAKAGNPPANPANPGARSSSPGPNVRNCRCAAGSRHRFSGTEGTIMPAEKLVRACLNELRGSDDLCTARDMAGSE